MSTTEIRSASAPLLVTSDCQRDEQGPAGASPVVASPAMPTLEGHFAVWNEWARIAELGGEFMERIAPGAFARSLAQDRNKIKVLFQHGRDPSIGSKPLGIPAVLREDERGGYYSVPLLDTSYVHDLLPGLRAGAYGASFRFTVTRQDWDERPARSSYNEDGLPERTIRDARVLELGPVVFPAYQGATAGVRSLTAWFDPLPTIFSAADIPITTWSTGIAR